MMNGSITLADVAARASHLEVACTRCGRRGRYQLTRLVEALGADFRITDLGSELENCPRRTAAIHERCDVFPRAYFAHGRRRRRGGLSSGRSVAMKHHLMRRARALPLVQRSRRLQTTGKIRPLPVIRGHTIQTLNGRSAAGSGRWSITLALRHRPSRSIVQVRSCPTNGHSLKSTPPEDEFLNLSTAQIRYPPGSQINRRLRCSLAWKAASHLSQRGYRGATAAAE
jgi:hypothetical protein